MFRATMTKEKNESLDNASSHVYKVHVVEEDGFKNFVIVVADLITTK